MEQQFLFGAEFQRKVDLSQWYTPKNVADMMYTEGRAYALECYERKGSYCRILEPAAGLGALMLPWLQEPKTPPYFRWVAHEIDPANIEYLKRKFIRDKSVRKTFLSVVEGDFFANKHSPKSFDLTVANTPFENNQDSDFVMASLELSGTGIFLLRSVFDQSNGRWERVWKWVNPEKEIRLIHRPSFGKGGSGSTPKSDFKIWRLTMRKKARKIGDIYQTKVVWQ